MMPAYGPLEFRRPPTLGEKLPAVRSNGTVGVVRAADRDTLARSLGSLPTRRRVASESVTACAHILDALSGLALHLGASASATSV
jgi:hypothetical protein